MLRKLRVADHPAAVWAGAVEPWLRAQGTQWRERRAVLAPNAAWVAALKAQAAENGLSTVGVAWFTPGKWRTQALRQRAEGPLRVALREDLHLLLELAAEKLPNNPLARAYGPDAAPFQEILDALDGAGWSGAALADPAARELAAAAAQWRAAMGWATVAEADRAVREFFAGEKAKRSGERVMGERLLAVGFGPGEWGLRALLEAAVAAYADSELVLDVVDYEQTPAAAWVGSWEEIAGPADWLEAETPAPFAPWAAAFLAQGARTESTRPVVTAEAPQLWLAEDLQGEADLVVAQALTFLGGAKKKEPVRVGVVVGPVNSPLAREVAARLAEWGLPCHDAPGHAPGRIDAQSLFEAWLDWQENARLDGLVGWLRTMHRLGRVDDEAARRMEQAWQAAAQATLTDDPGVIEAWLRQHEDKAAAGFMEEWRRLPERASWEEWELFIHAMAGKLGWPEAPEELAERMRGWAENAREAAPRGAVLRWVRAVTRVPGRTREAQGREPFAPLQIVDAASAAATPWTHLVLAGLQHGEWPAGEVESPLLEEARLKALNREAVREGSQGQGHLVVQPGRGLLPTSAERRRLERAGFGRLVGLPTTGLALTARRHEPVDNRPGRLSEYFWSVATLAAGRLPAESDWAALARASETWLEAVRLNWKDDVATRKNPAGDTDVTATGRAFKARRDGTKAFDEFSFALAQPPPKPLRISCKAWEEAVARPGAAWFKYLLRVEPRWDAATEDFARLSRGNWAHAWVRPGPVTEAEGGGRESQPMPAKEIWEKLAEARARDWRTQAEQAFAAAGRALPEAWLEIWALAGRVVAGWREVLAARRDWPQALAEARLPGGLESHIGGENFALPLTGRMDLVLLDRAATLTPGGLAGAAAWLIDFKTGGDTALKITRLAEGDGLQLALYALALRTLGAAPVTLSLLPREGTGGEPLALESLADEALGGLWQLLGALARDGRWGERHDLADEHGNPGDYPTATLPVPGEIVRRKWALTHPYFEI